MSKSPITIELLEQHLVVLGKTGSGKSVVLRNNIETVLDAKKRMCIIDPKGDHYGIKLGADGKSAGYPLMAFGDFKDPKASNLSINDKSGKEIGELVATGNRPCVIGFRGWMPAQMHRFWIDFASTLFNKNSSPLYLAIDEVHNFAPKGKVLSPEIGLCLHWSNRLGSEGRGLGIHLMIASQRPQKVHNDLLTCCETLVAMRVTHPSDRDAVADWLKEYSTDNDRGKLVLSSLSAMKRGEAFVWSPEAEFFERVTFPLMKTFDSFAAPKEGKQRELKGWAEVDMAEVQERLSKVIEESQANDPAILKKRIGELTKQVQQLERVSQKPTGSGPDPKATAREIEKFHAEYRRNETESYKRMMQYSGKVRRMAESAAQHIQTLLAESVPAPIETKSQAVKLPAAVLKSDIPPSVPMRPSLAPAESNGTMKKAQQSILNSLAWWRSLGHEKPSREMVAFVAGMRPTSGHFKNLVGGLRTTGFVDYPGDGKVTLTSQGEQIAVGPDGTPTGRDLFECIKSVLEPAQVRIFVVLWNKHELTRDALASEAGFQETSGHFKNTVGSLRTLMLCDYPSDGMVALRDWIREAQ